MHCFGTVKHCSPHFRVTSARSLVTGSLQPEGLTDDFSFKWAEFHAGRGQRHRSVSAGIRFLIALQLMSLWVLLFSFGHAQSPATQAGPAWSPSPKASGRALLKRSALGRGRGAKTIYASEDERSPSNWDTCPRASLRVQAPCEPQDALPHASWWSLRHRRPQSPVKPAWLWCLE